MEHVRSAGQDREQHQPLLDQAQVPANRRRERVEERLGQLRRLLRPQAAGLLQGGAQPQEAGRHPRRPRRPGHPAGLQAVQHGEDQGGGGREAGRRAGPAVPGRAVRQEAAVPGLPLRGHGRQDLHQVPQTAGDAELPGVRRLPPVLHLDAQLHRHLRLQDPAPHSDHAELITGSIGLDSTSVS